MLDPNVLVTWPQFPDHNIPRFSRPWLNQMIDAGTFPPPVRISANRIAWKLGELERWRLTRPEAHEPAPALWPPRERPRWRGSVTHDAETKKPAGRQRGSKVVVVDGRRRVLPPPAENADVA